MMRVWRNMLLQVKDLWREWVHRMKISYEHNQAFPATNCLIVGRFLEQSSKSSYTWTPHVQGPFWFFQACVMHRFWKTLWVSREVLALPLSGKVFWALPSMEESNEAGFYMRVTEERGMMISALNELAVGERDMGVGTIRWHFKSLSFLGDKEKFILTHGWCP